MTLLNERESQYEARIKEIEDLRKAFEEKTSKENQLNEQEFEQQSQSLKTKITELENQSLFFLLSSLIYSLS